ncbi:MAG: hypothetical protein Q9227_004302 [Pyrenula ochraceoflavens]
MNFDVDLGPWIVSDWYHGGVFNLDAQAQADNNVAIPESNVLNGKGVYDCDSGNDTLCSGQSEFYEAVFERGTSYKIGLLNSATLLTYSFYIDGHSFSVISADFVPIKPYVTSVLNIGSGQRYEIVVNANASVTNGTGFWIHAQYCGLPSLLDSRIGIIRYGVNGTSEPPASQSYLDFGCDDPAPSDLTPIVKQSVGPNVNKFNAVDYLYSGLGLLNNTWPGTQKPNGSTWLWQMEGNPLYIDWANPTVGQIAGLSSNQTLPDSAAPIYLDYADGDWVYYVVTSNFTTADVPGIYPNITLPPSVHPMHLHGHDFSVLAQGHDEFNLADVTPLLDNPVRRDTVDIPIGGWVWIAFQVGNPGAWLLHCHIAWHSSDGFGVQFIEQPGQVLGLMQAAGKTGEYTDRCNAWSEYYQDVSVPAGAVQGDSGV